MNQNLPTNELQLYKSFYAAYPDAILILEYGVIVGCNLSAQKFFQVNKEEDLIGKNLSYFTDKVLEQTLKEYDSLENYFYRCSVEESVCFECRIQTTQGKVLDAQIVFTKVEIEQRTLIQAILRDITQQKQLEKNYKILHEQEHKQLLAIREALDKSALISIADVQGKIIKVNEDFCRVSQYSETELLGKDHNIVNSGYHAKEFWQNMWQTISRGKRWRADVKNKAKDGSFYWVDTVINPMLDNEGKILSYLSIRYLITDKKQIEIELQDKQSQLQSTEEELRQNLEELEAQRDYIQEINKEIKEKSDISEKNHHALLELSKNQAIYTGNLEVAFEIITRKVAKTLNVERVGIWKYDTTPEPKIIAQKQYETTQEGYTFTQNTEIKQKDTPNYFADIVAEKNIIADFAQNHPALAEFVDSYLIPLQINSMLDIPYFIDGKLAGVICCETQKQFKNWTLEDISFVKGIADVIAMAIKTKQQLEEQEKVKQNEKLLFRFLNRIPAGIAIIDKNGVPFFTNHVAKKLLGEEMKISEGETLATAYPAKIAGTEEDYPQEKLPLILALQGEEVHVEDMEVIKEAKRIPLEATASPIRTDDGNIEYAISIFQDISERKAKEVELKKKNEELATNEEELRQNMEELQATQEAMREKQAIIEEAKVSLEKQNSKLLANEAVLKKTFQKMKLQETQLRENLDSLQAQEEELRQNMEELEATQERVNSAFAELDAQFNAISATFGYIELDRNRKITRVNPLLAKWFEYEVEELQHKRHIDIIPDTSEEKEEYEKIWQLVEKGQTYVGVFKRTTKSGKDLWLLGAYCPVKNEKGEVVRVIKIASNYNLQKQTEIEYQTKQEELLATEEELRQNMEELQATQEAMREKQAIIEDTKLSLEKQNNKLVANEAVLTKAFQKMKAQDVKLRESFDKLQAQEEELRQNMEELQATQEILASQKEILEISNRQMTKSISYAETIQKAVLPSKRLIKELLPESFVIYKPKDIVSGDFYWLSKHDKNRLMVGVIDCTGHGVPGAFMSLVASNLLSEIINQKGILQPSIILHELHKGVVKKLNQKEGANNDGMDLTLCLIEETTNKQKVLTFAGVKQNLYIVRDKELIELKGNRRSIGGGKRDEERQYTQEEIVLQKKDTIFLATDGYADQANEERKSFSKKSFRELMLEIGHLSAKEQMRMLEKRLAQHQGSTEQRDDITVFGFKIQN